MKTLACLKASSKDSVVNVFQMFWQWIQSTDEKFLDSTQIIVWRYNKDSSDSNCESSDRVYPFYERGRENNNEWDQADVRTMM